MSAPEPEQRAETVLVADARARVAGAITILSNCDSATEYPIASWLQYLRRCVVEMRQFDGDAS